MATYAIGISSWIIQDGNYPDFVRGQSASFAVEFYSKDGLRLAHDREASGPLGLTRISSSLHDLRARIIHATDDWWALDAGIGIFQERRPPEGAQVGSEITGRCMLGIDPFFYFEQLAHQIGAPALIYDWRIENIELNETPWVEVRPRSFERDTQRISWRSVDRTNAWSDDNQRAEYVMHCNLLSETPRNSRA